MTMDKEEDSLERFIQNRTIDTQIRKGIMVNVSKEVNRKLIDFPKVSQSKKISKALKK